MLYVNKKYAVISLILNFVLIIVILIQLYQIYNHLMLAKIDKELYSDEKLKMLSFCINSSIFFFVIQIISWFFKKYNFVVVAGGMSILLYTFKMILFCFQ